jgi:hypothetical protein
MALSFGVATASVVASWFLGGVDNADTLRFVSGLQRAFLTLGALTIVSSFVFRGLRGDDGNTVSQHRPAPVSAVATATGEAVD